MTKIVRNDVDNGNPVSLHSTLANDGHSVIGVTFHRGDLIIEFNDNENNIPQAEDIINDHSGYSVELAKRALKDKINLHRDIVVKDCFPHVIDGVTYYFDSDDRSAIRLDGLYASATFYKMLGWNFMQVYRDRDNNNHQFDEDDVIALFVSASTHESGTVFKAVGIKTQIDQLAYDTTEEIDALDPVELWNNYVES